MKNVWDVKPPSKLALQLAKETAKRRREEQSKYESKRIRTLIKGFRSNAAEIDGKVYLLVVNSKMPENSYIVVEEL